MSPALEEDLPARSVARVFDTPAEWLQVFRWALLAGCIARLWLVPLPSSFWVDEMVTAFVVNHPGHPSFAVAPQVPASIYYGLPRAAQAIFGSSEISYRAPSIIAMGLALFLIGRLAARLIHPQAAWFAVFACLSLRGINYHAADARPYALGICVASAALWLLIRWLDFGRWRDALGFVVAAALVWQIHLIYWPFYLVLALYTLARIAGKETPVSWKQGAIVFGLLGAALVPVALHALFVLRGAGAHVITYQPRFRDFEHAIRWNLVLICAGGAWILSWLFNWPESHTRVTAPSWVLIASWWLGQFVCLYVFSHVSGSSVFISRYLSLALPGIALMATAAAARWIPAGYWPGASTALGIGALIMMGQWTIVAPRHDNSDWRAAAREENRLAISADMPVICLSPFVEGRSPVWRPDYPLPGFLYAHLPYYPIKGRVYLFPFGEAASDGLPYAARLVGDTLPTYDRFMIYGVNKFWLEWFRQRPELKGWRSTLEKFGDVQLALFDRPGPPITTLIEARPESLRFRATH